MMKKFYSFLVVFFLILLLLFIFTNSVLVNEVISFSYDIFINSVFPSLFPMFLISSLLVAMGIPKVLGSLFAIGMQKLFKVKGISSFIIFMSMLTGFPSSAKYIAELLDKNLITIEDAKKVLLFSFFSNPLFIINTVGILFLNNKTYGFLILLAHILANFILGIILRNYLKKEDNTVYSIKDSLKEMVNNINNSNVFAILFTTIKNSLGLLLSIFGTITFFLILTNFVTLPFFSLTLKAMVAGVLEMTSGLKYVSMLDYSLKVKAYLSVFLISFGGLSIHTQIMSILSKYKIPYLPFLLSRIFHAIISIVVLFLLFLFSSL